MWLVNGRPIYPDMYHKMLVRENGIHSLVIEPLTQKDAGTYMCIASNKAGQCSFSLELKVVGKDRSQSVRLESFNVTATSLLGIFTNPSHVHFRERDEAPTPVPGEAAECRNS